VDSFPYFPHQNWYALFFIISASYLAHLILVHLVTRVIFGECKSKSSSLRTSLQPAVALLLGPDSFLCTIFSSSFSPLSFLIARDRVSHPYKIRDRILVLYVSTFTFLLSRVEAKNSAPHSCRHSPSTVCS
jgi:hypothetical protein